MIKKQFLLVISLLMLNTTAQKKEITVETIYKGTFKADKMESLHSMKDGQFYTVYNFDRRNRTSSVDKYDYKTLKKVGTIVDSKTLNNIQSFSGYTFSSDEKKILLETEKKPIYRHSKTGKYYVYDLNTKTIQLVYNGAIQEPTFSPDGNQVAFVFENNIYIKNISDGSLKKVTKDGKKNEIINGITDWVYEEEFAFVRAFQWSTSGDRIAFLKFDEKEVPEFSMDVYGKGLYQTQQVFKYPKAGEKNAVVSLHIFDLNSNSTKDINLGDYSDFYIPRIQWTAENNYVCATVLNRHQNNLDLHFVDASSGKTKIVLNETDKAYIDITDNLTFLNDNSFIWTSEKDGFNHIYHYSNSGKLQKQITSGYWEVTKYYGFDEKNQTIFYQGVEDGSTNRTVYSIKIDGKNKKLLSRNTGTNNAEFSADFSYFINDYTDSKTPNIYTLHETKSGKLIKEIKNNNTLKNIVKSFQTTDKEYFTLKTDTGNELNAYMIKPIDFDSSKKYPLLLFQYSGPGSQQVANKWLTTNDYWHQMIANKGIIIACVDGRGTGFKGAEFKKITYKELGKYEVEDQIAAAKVLGRRSYIDASKIGIWGWSYGGFMSSNCLLQGNDIFSMAIAVAPVTSWRFYDTIYTERYMRTPQENPSGYDNNSPLSHVNKLKGDYLLIHGTADDNVHVQNAYRMVEDLVQANKNFDWAIYPDKNHGIYGGKTRVQLFNKMTKFIENTLLD